VVKRHVNVSEILQVIKTILNNFNPVFRTVIETVSKIYKIARLSGWKYRYYALIAKILAIIYVYRERLNGDRYVFGYLVNFTAAA